MRKIVALTFSSSRANFTAHAVVAPRVLILVLFIRASVRRHSYSVLSCITSYDGRRWKPTCCCSDTHNSS